MKKVAFLFVLLVVASNAMADYQYFFFKEEGVHISRDQYRRYVRPQLVSIVNEYYSLLKKLDPQAADPIELKEQVLNLSKEWQAYMRTRCPSDKDECLKARESIYKLALKIDTQILRMQAKPLALQTFPNEEHRDSEINLTRSTDQLSLLIYRLIHKLEENHLFEKTPFAYFNNSQKEITDIITQLKISTELLVTQKLDPAFKKDFDRLWIGYIVIIEQEILDESGPEKLIHKMGGLNVSWNTFHMKMTKGNDAFPRNLISHVTMMHNRWNSFLKTALR